MCWKAAKAHGSISSKRPLIGNTRREHVRSNSESDSKKSGGFNFQSRRVAWELFFMPGQRADSYR
jgi:hypothetical protein